MAKNTRSVSIGLILTFVTNLLIQFEPSRSFDDDWNPADLPTSISFRKEPRNVSHIMATNATSYIELVQNSDIFVDKSLLIKTIFESSHAAILVTAPRGWGKSTNLDMIKTFVQLGYDSEGQEQHPVGASSSHKFFSDGEIMWTNDNYGKLQNPLLISAYDEFIYDHLGKYPVIKVEMKKIAFGNSFEAVLDNFRVYLKDLFNQFRFVVKPLYSVMQDEAASRSARRRSHQMLCKYATFVNMNQENVTNLQHSIKFLCGLLFNHFRRRIVILVDDYDYHLNILINKTHPFPKEEEPQLVYFFKSIMRFTFKDNTYLEKGILTGTQQFGTGAHHTPNTIGEFNYVFENPFLHFYGFTNSEMVSILSHLQIADKLAQVRDWYSGYYSNFRDYRSLLYSPPSVAQFLATRKFVNYLDIQGDTETIDVILSMPKFRSSMEILVNYRTITINAKCLYLTKQDIDCLQLLVQQSVLSELGNRRTTIEIALAYLTSAGYLGLTTVQSQIQPYRMVSVGIPNLQMMDEFCANLIEQYKKDYPVQQQGINLVVEKFHKCIQGDRPELFNNALQNLFDNVTLFQYQDKINATFVNRTVHHSMLNLIAISMRSRYGYRTVVSEEYARPNLILYGDKVTTVVHTRTEHVMGRSRNAALARKFRHVISTVNISMITYMVWDFYSNKKMLVDVSREVLSRPVQRNEFQRR